MGSSQQDVASGPIDPRTIAIALTVALANFMQMLDGIVISIALPSIARDFGASPVSVGFGITIYVLAAAIMLPVSAWLADRIGPKTLFVGAMAAFAVASALCGLSSSLSQFIAARALQGLAGALMAPIGQMILLRSVERSQLLRVMTFTSTPALVAPVIGPPLGGLLTTWFGWESIFTINLPACAVAIAMAVRFLPRQPREQRPFDGTGFLLNTAALVPLLWGLSEVGGRHVDRSIAVAAIAIGLAMGVAAIRHARRAPNPLLPLGPLRHSTFRLTSGSSTFFIRLPVVAMIFVLPILLQNGFGMTPFLAGLLFLGHSGGDLLMKFFTTRLFRRLGYRTTLLMSASGVAASIAATALFTKGTPLAVIAAVLFVSGCFRSFMLTGLSTLSFSDLERDEMGSGTTFNQVVVQLSTALGVSLAGILFDVGHFLRGEGPGITTANDCRLAIVVLAAMALLSLPFLRQLPETAGRTLSGHRARG